MADSSTANSSNCLLARLANFIQHGFTKCDILALSSQEALDFVIRCRIGRAVVFLLQSLFGSRRFAQHGRLSVTFFGYFRDDLLQLASNSVCFLGLRRLLARDH